MIRVFGITFVYLTIFVMWNRGDAVCKQEEAHFCVGIGICFQKKCRRNYIFRLKFVRCYYKQLYRLYCVIM